MKKQQQRNDKRPEKQLWPADGKERNDNVMSHLDPTTQMK